MRRTRTYSPATLDAVAALGTQIATARRQRRMTVAELCERAGITPNTVRAIESGAPTVGVGVVFEVAVLLGVPLFAETPMEVAAIRERVQERLALLPRRVRAVGEVDDDF
ncbi:MAG: helix-turn-helix domain-containing protein [Cellulomonas sp.]|nr:helix-turn-helix domain-containing protein [Cellulomonas sp.]